MGTRYWLGMLDETGVEFTAAGYSRQAFRLVPLKPEMLTQTNDFVILFGPALEKWGKVSNFGIFDSPSGGELLGRHPAENLVILKGEGLRLEPGQFSVQLRLDGGDDEFVSHQDGALN